MKNGKKDQERGKERKEVNLEKRMDESHRRALHQTESDAEIRRKEATPEATSNEGDQKWQQLSEEERKQADSRRGGYPKNVSRKSDLDKD